MSRLPLATRGNDSDTEESLARHADKFTQAFYKQNWIGELDPSVSELSIAEAYEVQDLVVEARILQGEEIAGYKVGCIAMLFLLNSD